MADVVQMGVNEFWRSVQKLGAAARTEAAALEANRLRLQHAYSAARADTNAVRGAQRMEVLKPLIHENSTLRLQYRSLVAKFNEAVNAARGTLQRFGYSVPGELSGLGFGPIVAATVSVVAVSLLLLGWKIADTIKSRRRALETATDYALRVIADPNATAAQRDAAMRVLDQVGKQTPKGDGLDLFGLKDLTPILGLAALIVLGPSLLQMLPRRKSAA